MCNIALFDLEFKIFLPFLCGNSKNLEHESCSTFKTLQLPFQAKVYLSKDLKVVFKAYFI